MRSLLLAATLLLLPVSSAKAEEIPLTRQEIVDLLVDKMFSYSAGWAQLEIFLQADGSFFESASRRLALGSATFRGTYRIEDGKVCVTGGLCRAVVKDGDVYLIYDIGGPYKGHRGQIQFHGKLF